MKTPHSSLIIPAAFLLGSLSAQAAITYVDAQEGSSGNTFATGGSLGTTDWIDTTSNTSNADNANWMKRFTAPGGASVGWSEHNGSDVIQGLVDPLAGNTLGEITTEVTGLANGTYNVWVFFWEQTVSGSQNWVIDAGLTSGSLDAFSSAAGPVAGTDSGTPVLANTLDFSNSPSTLAAEGNQSMYGVFLGQTTGSSINVYVDKLTGAGSTNRTIFDGVGYEAVPEPSALALVGLAALGLLARRRR